MSWRLLGHERRRQFRGGSRYAFGPLATMGSSEAAGRLLAYCLGVGTADAADGAVRVPPRGRSLPDMRIFNLHSDEWDRAEDREGWRSRHASVGRHIGAELIGGSMYELEAGDRLWPYHTHHANEEWLIVVRGNPTLRTPEGEKILREGDVVCFPRGKEGAHQVINRTDTAIRVLMLSTVTAPDIVEYFDSGKIGARSVHGERIMLSRPGPMLDYWEGED